MWSATHGEIPAGLSVLHRCDNPPCCNPAHLFLGTRADNVADMIAKGRDRRGRFPGEKCNFAKLKESDVVEIRKRLAPQKTLAAHYGVNVTTIQRIQYKQNWSHV